MAAAACGAPRRAPSPSAAVSGDPCTIVNLATRRDTLRLALLAPVDPRHAPGPTNDDERLVFRQLYEPLVHVDCAGVVKPGLAVRWRSVGDTLWTFTLRGGARFWDGTPVDASTALAGWQGTGNLPVRAVWGSGDSVVVVVTDVRTPVEAFGDAAWSVVKRIPESAWPLGTGWVWMRGGRRDGRDSVLDAFPVPGAPRGTPALRFQFARGTDPRDLLDGGTDVLSTRDAGVLRYAAGRTEWHIVPLVWDRLYAFLSLTRLRGRVTARLDQDALAALAHDAVRDEARPYDRDSMPDDWWADTRCAPVVAPPDRRVDGLITGGVAYALDPVARDLANRLVARPDAELRTLVGRELRPPVTTLALLPHIASVAVPTGGALGYVLPLPSRPLDACRAIDALARSLPWLRDPSGVIPPNGVAPLVETRAHLLVRGVPAVRRDWDGGAWLLGGSRP
jgi:hypothetical protein